MDRRGFLRTTFVTGLAAGTGCAADMADRAAKAPLDDAELDRKLARLERTLARMDGRFASDWFLAQRRDELDDPQAAERLAGEGELVRTALRVATAVSTLAELPEASQRDPRVVSQVSKLIGEADYAVFGSLAKLDALDDAAFAELDRELADESASIERMSEQVESLARSLDVPLAQRVHLRTMAKQVGWRLQREGAAAVVRDSVAKTDAMLEGAHRRILEAGGPNPAAFDQRWVARTQAATEVIGPSASAGASAEQIADARAEYEQTKRNRNILLGTGAAMIAVGAGLATVGAYILLADGGATVTIGGIGMTAGVIVLILAIWLAVRTKRLRRDLERLEAQGA